MGTSMKTIVAKQSQTFNNLSLVNPKKQKVLSTSISSYINPQV